MARKPTPAQARERRARLLAIGLGAFLVLVAAIQVPRTLKLLHGSKPVAVPAPAAVAPGATATPAVAPRTGHGQLASFSRFSRRDPFRGDPAAKPQTAAPAASAPKPAPVAVPKPKPAARPAKPADRVVLFAQKPVKPDAAVIRLDGRRQVVPLKTTFPAKRPTFKLVALGDGSARIGVVAGSFAGGSPTLKLRVGQKLTLQNTVDRARSTLVLVRLTTKAAAP
jgi:hypothetical protein